MPIDLAASAQRPNTDSPRSPRLRIADDGARSSFLAPYQSSTQRTYRKALAALAAWLGCPLDLVPATRWARRYQGERLAAGVAPASVNGALAALRSLIRTLRAMDQLDWVLEVHDVWSSQDSMETSAA